MFIINLSIDVVRINDASNDVDSVAGVAGGCDCGRVLAVIVVDIGVDVAIVIVVIMDVVVVQVVIVDGVIYITIF